MNSGHVGVDRFVVRDAIADGVCERHVAGAICAHKSGHAEHGIRAKRQRIEKLVVHAAVDHVHALAGRESFSCKRCRRPRSGRALRPARFPSAARESCARNRRCCECRASAARSARRLRRAAKGCAECAKAPPDSDGPEEPRRPGTRRAACASSPAIFEHVGNSARRADVVFEHVEIAASLNRAPDQFRRCACKCRAKLRRRSLPAGNCGQE